MSIIPAIFKIFERVMNLELVNHLETNELLDNDYHGFWIGESIVSAGIYFVETLIDPIGKSDNVMVIFMDLRI